MRKTVIALCCLFFATAALYGQEARGSITGHIADLEGNAIADVTVVAENLQTGLKYQTVTTSTGNYLLPNLMPGAYHLSTSHGEYKSFRYENAIVASTQPARIDIYLEPNEGGDDPDAHSHAIPQRFDSGQWTHNVTSETTAMVPLFGFPAGKNTEGRIRNPLFALQVTPGSFVTELEYLRINGAPSNTAAIRVEGQDANNGFLLSQTMQNQVGIEAVEEFAVQTTGYAPEFGQAGSGIINISLKSGGNAYHGSGFEYWSNEIMNASQPYTNIRPRNRRNNYGATLGGPLPFPKLSSGHEETFFFANFEQFRQDIIYNDQYLTVPTKAYRDGDFRKALTGRKLGTDPVGRSIMEGTIYNPATERIVDGKRVRDPFPRNTVPKSLMDPVALNIQNLIPLPTNSDLTDNYRADWESKQHDTLGSIKVDQKYSRSSISFYYGFNQEASSQRLDQGGDGFLSAVTSNRPTDARADTFRVSYDRIASPTRTMHLGFGYQLMKWSDEVENDNFNQETELGLTGANLNIFPYITGLRASMGGMKDMGPSMQSLSNLRKPTANASLTWIRKNHTYKIGAEFRLEKYPTTVKYPGYGYYNFSADQTGQPSTEGQNLQGGTVGFPYASFLLGLVNNGDIGVVSEPELGKSAWAFYAQDSWKMSTRLTVEYGVRYDYQTYFKESEGRIPSFSPTELNPSAGNLPGYVIYEGSGTGHCNCNFARVYPYAFAPRVGAVFELMPRLVFRAGFGIMYGQTAAENRTTLRSGSTNAFASTTFGNPALLLRDGAPDSGAWPNLNRDLYLIGNGGSLTAVDINAGRPPRQMLFNFSVQSRIMKDMSVEVSYVMARGTGWESNGLINVNALSPERLDANNLDLDVAEDRELLMSAINSSLAIRRGFNKPPYEGFPENETVAQSLRPFPQYGDIAYRWAPFGRTWYDSAQIKLIKRYSHGFAVDLGYSWQKETASGAENMGGYTSLEAINNAYDANANKHTSALSRTSVFYVAPTFTFPQFSGRKTLSPLLRNWRFSAIVQYAPGLPIRTPVSNSKLYLMIFQSTFANRIPGTGLFTANLDKEGINPLEQFALKPDAWKDPDPGKFSTSPGYYDDYRFERRPLEQMSFGRIFRVSDKVQLMLRIDFQNVFNRLEMADPVYENAGATQVYDKDDVPQSGFGYVNYKTVGGNPRTGQVVVRLQF